MVSWPLCATVKEYMSRRGCKPRRTCLDTIRSASSVETHRRARRLIRVDVPESLGEAVRSLARCPDNEVGRRGARSPIPSALASFLIPGCTRTAVVEAESSRPLPRPRGCHMPSPSTSSSALIADAILVLTLGPGGDLRAVVVEVGDAVPSLRGRRRRHRCRRCGIGLVVVGYLRAVVAQVPKLSPSMLDCVALQSAAVVAVVADIVAVDVALAGLKVRDSYPRRRAPRRCRVVAGIAPPSSSASA